jgi:hypothetical protein
LNLFDPLQLEEFHQWSKPQSKYVNIRVHLHEHESKEIIYGMIVNAVPTLAQAQERIKKIKPKENDKTGN